MNGRYIISDPRTVFYIPQDNQVIVYFEWEGPLGAHHLEGVWKNPDGKVVVLSDFDYESKQKRFGGYWTLPLSSAVSPGLWTLEAHVDGEVAGAHTFQIVAAARPEAIASVKQPLSPSDIYKNALASTVSVEALDGAMRPLSSGSGFFIAKGLMLTGFEVIDGASSVRITLPDGRRADAQGMVVWDRLQDWAILAVPIDVAALAVAKANSWQVGDECFTLDVAQENNRTITDGNVTGHRIFPDVGDRLDVSFGLAARGAGAPILNEYGEVIGLYVRRSLLPGSSSVDVLSYGFPTNMYSPTAPSQERLAVPVSLIRMPDAPTAPHPFGDLARAGQFTPPLVGFRNLSRGTIARQVQHSESGTRTIDEKFEYSRRDGDLAVTVTFEPREKVKALSFLRVYDLDGHLVGTSKPRKVTLSPGHTVDSWWQLDISTFRPRIYRVDVVLDPNPVWRGFFRVVE